MQLLLIVTLPYLLLILVIAGAVGLRLLYLRKQRDISNEKIQFFLNTAHDIRTPLMLVKTPLEELQESEKLSPQGKAKLEDALRNVNTLMRLTINLISFERAANDNAPLVRSPQELNAFINDMLAPFHSYAEESRISLTYESNFNYLDVYIDAKKIELILKNLISNALKYTPTGGKVRIIATELSNSWSVEVVDTGIGIPAGEQQKLFKMHYRGENEVNNRISGGGIGLLVVDREVRQHGGKISLNSSNGKGTSVKVTFPKSDEEKTMHNEEQDWKFIATVNRHIQQHMSDSGFNVETLCSLLGMSRTSFYNKIKALTDESPADYIRIIRLKRAAQLLEQQQHTVTEVAELTGFNDAKYFREVFKKHFGMSPSQYAKKE